MDKILKMQAQTMANKLGQQIVVLQDNSDGNYYALPAIQWLSADGHVQGMEDYRFVAAIDPND